MPEARPGWVWSGSGVGLTSKPGIVSRLATPSFLAKGGMERHNQRTQNIVECGAFLRNDHD